MIWSGNKSVFRPKLVLFIRSEDGLAVDAELSSATRQFLKTLVSKQNEKAPLPSKDESSDHCGKSFEEGIDFVGKPDKQNNP